MSDESLLELERAARAAPDDVGATLRLVAALARAGRRREALDHLDLARVPADAFARARELSERLWREELLALAPSHVIPARGPRNYTFDYTDRWIAWTELDRPGLRVAPLAGGPAHNVLPAHEPSSVPMAESGGFFAWNEREETLTHVRLDGDEVILDEHELPGPGAVPLSISSSRGRILVEHRDGDHWRVGVHAWPSREPILVRPRGDRTPEVDWGLGLLFVEEDGHVRAFPFDGALPPALDLSKLALPWARIGRGLIAETSSGLVLHHLVRGWSLRLLEADHALPFPDLASDERGLRLVMGGKLVRIEIDIERGRLLHRPPDADPAKIVEDDFRRVGWHPFADLALVRRSDGVVLLRGPGDEIVRDFGPIAPDVPDWIEGWHGIAFRRADLGGLEVWRATMSS